jgi:hypothetical protein
MSRSARPWRTRGEPGGCDESLHLFPLLFRPSVGLPAVPCRRRAESYSTAAGKKKGNPLSFGNGHPAGSPSEIANRLGEVADISGRLRPLETARGAAGRGESATSPGSLDLFPWCSLWLTVFRDRVKIGAAFSLGAPPPLEVRWRLRGRSDLSGNPAWRPGSPVFPLLLPRRENLDPINYPAVTRGPPGFCPAGPGMILPAAPPGVAAQVGGGVPRGTAGRMGKSVPTA